MRKIHLKPSSLPFFAIALCVLAMIIFVVVRVQQDSKHKSGTIPSKSPAQHSHTGTATSNNSSSSSPRVGSSSSSGESSDKNSSLPGSTTEGGALSAPTGTFVSNHKVSLGNRQTLQEESVCITTPGAFCGIVLTNGGITKTLAAKQTDGNGTVVWDWNVSDAGFTQGLWHITATARLNDASKTTSDPQNLEISP